MTDLGSIFDRLGLGQYLDRFFEEGFETWETVLDVTESDLYRLQREIANIRGVDIETIINAAPKSMLQRQAQHSVSDYADSREVDGAQRNKRKYRRHPKADGHAPDRPQSAYVIFSNKIRDDLKTENLSFTEIAKRVGELWQALTPEGKKPFENQAGVAKEEYLSDLAHYKMTDKFKEYTHYLADFKAKHPSKPDGKKPKHGNHTSPTSSETAGRRRDSTEPRHDDVSQEPDQPTYRDAHGHRQTYDGRTAEATSAYVSNHFFPRPRGSPSASVSSLASSGLPTKSTSPSIQHTPRQLPPERGSLERNAATCPSPLSPVTTFEHRETPLAQGSTVWFNSRPGTAPSYNSPLSNYRRSHQPPPSFIHQTSTSSSRSTCQSVESVDSTTTRSNKAGEEARLYHNTPNSTRGSETQYSADKTNEIESARSRARLESPVLPVASQDYHSSSHRNLPLPSLPLDVGNPSSPPPPRVVNSSASGGDPAGSYPYPSFVKTTLPRKRKGSEPDDDEIIGRPPPPVDPLAVLAYAGGIMDRQPRETF
ncbi:MAG: hypothetical protein Q9211_002597 [Gyalolechia sp. 1 TL-2023]